jgi:hypothetical protein
VDTTLVHRNGGESRVGSDNLADQLLERVGLARELPGGDTERAEHDLEVGSVERERALEHRAPLLEPAAVDGLEPLHVHQALANLHRSVALLREEVELVTLLHPLRLAQAEDALGGAEALAEGAPLPPRDDAGDGIGRRGGRRPRTHDFFFASARAKYSSALRVFVSCSPERSTPCSTR